MIYVYLLVGWLCSLGVTGLYAGYKGYEYANNAAEVRELKADLYASQQAQRNLQEAVNAANEQDQNSAKALAANQEKIDALQHKIDTTPSNPCTISDDFLRDLSAIK